MDNNPTIYETKERLEKTLAELRKIQECVASLTDGPAMTAYFHDIGKIGGIAAHWVYYCNAQLRVLRDAGHEDIRD